MTSLKVKYANEIAEAMAKTLEDSEFIQTFNKTASEDCADCGDSDIMLGDDKETNECPECSYVKDKCQCAKDVIAAEFALTKLVKVADALDNKGCQVIANLIDEVMTKIAAKKEKAEKSKESKKSSKKSDEKEEDEKTKESKKSSKESKKSDKE